MIRSLVRSSWLALLGVALATLSAGCQDANEAEFREGGPDRPGVADPKYADGSPETYQQHAKDLYLQKKAAPAKGKAAPAKGKAAAAPPPPAPEPEKKD
jgi:hypothetical protein